MQTFFSFTFDYDDDVLQCVVLQHDVVLTTIRHTQRTISLAW